jgi:phosphopantetheinyl transferase (holo-ACP synthase)
MLGIDIVDIERVKNIYQKHGLFFLRKVLDEKEIKALPAEGNANFFRTMSGLLEGNLYPQHFPFPVSIH